MKAAESVSQIVCWHCEEPVHRYASRCPYCQKDISSNSSDDLDESHDTATPKISAQPDIENNPFGKIESLYGYSRSVYLFLWLIDTSFF